MKILQSLLDLLLGVVKLFIAMGALFFVAMIAAFFMMIALPTQTQAAFQFFLELIFR